MDKEHSTRVTDRSRQYESHQTNNQRQLDPAEEAIDVASTPAHHSASVVTPPNATIKKRPDNPQGELRYPTAEKLREGMKEAIGREKTMRDDILQEYKDRGIKGRTTQDWNGGKPREVSGVEEELTWLEQRIQAFYRAVRVLQGRDENDVPVLPDPDSPCFDRLAWLDSDHQTLREELSELTSESHNVWKEKKMAKE